MKNVNELTTGTIKRIRLVSEDISFGLLPRPGLEIEQHLTICGDGRVYFSGYAFTEYLNYTSVKLCRRRRFRIPSMDAAYLVNMIGIFFRDNDVNLFDTDVGYWKLEIENDKGERSVFNGSLCQSLSVDGKDLSMLIRKYLSMPELFCFDGDSRFPVKRGTDEYIFVNVTFSGHEKTYCYICDDDLIREHDEVRVPVGNDGDIKTGTVESVVVCTPDRAPYPFESCRKVISRMTT